MASQTDVNYEEEKTYPWNFRVYQPFEFLDVASMVVLACLNGELNLPLLAGIMPIELNSPSDGAYTSIRYYDKDSKETIIRGTHGGTWVEAITMTIMMDGSKYTVRVMKEKIHTTGLDNEMSVHQLVLSIIGSIQGLYQAISYARSINPILSVFSSTVDIDTVVPIEQIDYQLEKLGLLIKTDPDKELTEEQECIHLLVHLLKCHYIEKNNIISAIPPLESDSDNSKEEESFDDPDEEFVPVKPSDNYHKITWSQWFRYFLQVVEGINAQTLYADLAPSYYYKGNIYYSFNIPFSIDTDKLMAVYNQVKPDFLLEYNCQLSTSIRFEVEYNLHEELSQFVTKRNNRRRITISFTVNGVATFTGPCQSLMSQFYKIVMDFLYKNRARIEDFSPIQYQRKGGAIDPAKIYRRYYFYHRHKADELLVDPEVLDSCHCEDDHLPIKLPRFPLVEFSTSWTN